MPQRTNEIAELNPFDEDAATWKLGKDLGLYADDEDQVIVTLESRQKQRKEKKKVKERKNRRQRSKSYNRKSGD